MIRLLPNFICPGVQKAGTTTLYHILKNHKDVYLNEKKEIHFFNNDQNFFRGLEWYSKHFLNVNKKKVIGEITPEYMTFDYVAKRIHETVGNDIKFVILLRNPVDRAYSQFNHHRNFGLEKESNFFTTIKKERVIKKIKYRKSWFDPPYYLSKGLYYEKIKQYYNIFGRENTLIIIFEELYKLRRKDIYKNLFKFLNIPPLDDNLLSLKSNRNYIPINKTLVNLLKKCENYIVGNKHYKSVNTYYNLRKHLINTLTIKPRMIRTGIKKDLLESIFLEDIKKLEDLTKIDFGLWYDLS